jgi:hypothetical protein
MVWNFRFRGQKIKNQQLLPKRLQVLTMATKRQKLTIYYESFGYKSISISKDPRLLDREAYKIALFIVQKVLQEFVVFFNVEIMYCVLLHKTMYVRRNFQYFEVV